MKRIIVVFMLMIGVAFAATLTVTIPNNDVPRVSAAFTNIYQLPQPATMNDVAAATQQWIIQQTQSYERSQYVATYSPTPMAMQTPTPTPSPSPTPTASPTPTPTSTP